MKIITFFACLITAVSFGQDHNKKIDEIFTELANDKKFNGNVLVAEKGNIVYQKSFGFANEATGEMLNNNTIFELASVSKQFTAAAIAILEQNKKLSYEDDLAKFIPELAFYKGVKIKHLIHHTGGLPDYMELMYFNWDKSKIATNKDMIAILAEKKPTALFEPNTKFEYSNTGYALLGSIIEKVSGKTYGNFLQDNIFKPLKMNSSFVYTRRYAPKKVENYAYGYVYSEALKKYVLPDEVDGEDMVYWLDGIVGDGTVNSTTGDLLKWDRALYGTALLPKAAIDRLFEPIELNDKTKSNYGFGWMIEDLKDYGKIVSHSGGWGGYSTYIERHITNDKTIIILENSTSSFPVNKLRKVLYDIKEEAKTEIKLPDAILASYVGEYELAPGYIVAITKDGNQLNTQLTGQQAFPIYPYTETKFFLKVVEANIEFVKDDKGVVTKLVLNQNGREIPALRKKV